MSSSAIAEDHVLVGGRITAGSGFTNPPISSAGKDSAEGIDTTRKTAKTATKDGKGTKRRQTDPSSKDSKDAKDVRGDAPATAAEKQARQIVVQKKRESMKISVENSAPVRQGSLLKSV